MIVHERVRPDRDVTLARDGRAPQHLLIFERHLVFEVPHHNMATLRVLRPTQPAPIRRMFATGQAGEWVFEKTLVRDPAD